MVSKQGLKLVIIPITKAKKMPSMEPLCNKTNKLSINRKHHTLQEARGKKPEND